MNATEGWSEDASSKVVQCLAHVLLDFQDSTPASYRGDAEITVVNTRQILCSLSCPFQQCVAAFAGIFLHWYLWQTYSYRSEGHPALIWWPWGEVSPALLWLGHSCPLPRRWHFAAWKRGYRLTGSPEAAEGKSLLYLPSIYLLELCMLRLGFCRSDCTQVLLLSLSHAQRFPQDLGPMDPIIPRLCWLPLLKLQRVNAPNFVASVNPLCQTGNA